METPLKNPNQRALVTLSGLAGSALLVTLAVGGLGAAGFANPALAWISGLFSIFFAGMWLVIWLLGRRQVRLSQEFLASDRPLVRWSYSPAEWRQLKESFWQEEKGDWKLQWGCLGVLLGLAGLLAGGMVGLEEGAWEALVNGLAGMVLGGLAGGVIGALVAGGNLLGARQAYRRDAPGVVALAPDELFASDDYFRGDGVNGYIRSATIRPSPVGSILRSHILELHLIVPPRPRMPREEQWDLPIPDHMVEQVEQILPRLAGAPDPPSQ